MNKQLSLGQKIKAFRNRQEMSQLELEIATDSSPGSISRIENDKVNPTKESISKIANALDISARELTLLYEIYFDTSLTDSIVTLKDDLISHIDMVKLQQKLISDLLVQLDKKEKYLTSSFSKVSFKYKQINLIAISNSLIANTIKTKMFQENVYRPIEIEFKDNTLTTEAAVRGKILYSNDLIKFLSPPLSTQLTKFIQKIFSIRAMVAIPLLNNSGECFGVINVALEKSVNDLSVVDKERFAEIGEILSELIFQISNISIKP